MTRIAASTNRQSRTRKPILVSWRMSAGTVGSWFALPESGPSVPAREDDGGVPDVDQVAVCELPRLHRRAVDRGAVGRSEVVQHGGLPVEVDVDVPSGDRGVGESERGVLTAADHVRATLQLVAAARAVVHGQGGDDLRRTGGRGTVVLTPVGRVLLALLRVVRVAGLLVTLLVAGLLVAALVPAAGSLRVLRVGWLLRRLVLRRVSGRRLLAVLLLPLLVLLVPPAPADSGGVVGLRGVPGVRLLALVRPVAARVGRAVLAGVAGILSAVGLAPLALVLTAFLRSVAPVIAWLTHASHSCPCLRCAPTDIRIDERADAELPGVQGLGLFERHRDVAERLPSLLVEILPDHVRQCRGDTLFGRTQALLIRRTKRYPVVVRCDRDVALLVEVVGGLTLQRVRHLGRLDLAAEEPGEGVADRALELALECLHDAHRHLLSRLVRSTWSVRPVLWACERPITAPP